MQVGQERISLSPGDSILAPRKIPHVWAHIGETKGRMLIAFMPTGNMEAYFREVTKADAMPRQDPEFLRAYGMELLGSPLPIDCDRVSCRGIEYVAKMSRSLKE